MNRKLATVMFTALAGTPLAGALTATPTSAATVKAHTYKGSTVNTQWGPIQVVITVKGKKITAVKVTDPTHTARSQVLDGRAVPILIQETLSAQSSNINEVSGATTISQAYISSLQAAVKSAHLA
ncbi:MAG TPA: FMN-binding protein [Chloroflexota bacterium]